MAANKIITEDELAKHTSSDDLWMAIYGKVYDITSFLDDHPGGDEVLKDTAGRDATEEFDDVGHSDEAVEMMEQYYVGDLKGAKQKTKEVTTKKEFPVRTTPSQQSRWQRLTIPIIVIVLTLVIRYVIVNGLI